MKVTQTTPRKKFTQQCAMCGHEHMLHARCKKDPSERADLSKSAFERRMTKYVDGWNG